MAFVGFNNLSRNAKDAWLAPALSEMLGAELSVTDMQVVPDELVRDASGDLSAPAAGGYAPQTLRRLRQRLPDLRAFLNGAMGPAVEMGGVWVWKASAGG